MSSKKKWQFRKSRRIEQLSTTSIFYDHFAKWVFITVLEKVLLQDGCMSEASKSPASVKDDASSQTKWIPGLSPQCLQTRVTQLKIYPVCSKRGLAWTFHGQPLRVAWRAWSSHGKDFADVLWTKRQFQSLTMMHSMLDTSEQNAWFQSMKAASISTTHRDTDTQSVIRDALYAFLLRESGDA